MATVIRSPQVNISPRRLKKKEQKDSAEAACAVLESGDSDDERIEAQMEEPVEPIDYETLTGEIERLSGQLSTAEAKAENADRELEALRSELQSNREAAEKAGQSEGYEQGLSRGEQQYQERLDMLAKVIETLNQKYQDAADQAEDLIVEIAFAAITKIVGEVFSKPENVVEVANHFAKEMIRRDGISVHISPRDYKALGMDEEGLLKRNPAFSRIIADGRVELGGCILETEAGALDARLEKQLESLKRALLAHHDDRKRTAELEDGE